MGLLGLRGRGRDAVRCWRQEEEEGFGRTPPVLATSPPKGSAKWDPNSSSFLVGPSPQIRLRQSFERGAPLHKRTQKKRQ